MDKKELKKLIEEVSNQIKANSKDARFADKLIDRLLSLKGQYDVEPAWSHFPVTENDEVIDTGGAYKIIRNNYGVNFHVTGFDFTKLKNGYNVSIKNFLKSAHCPFDRLFELWDKKNKGDLSEDEEEEYGTLLVATVSMCQIINIASTSEHRQALLSVLVGEWFDEMMDAMDANLNEETSQEYSDIDDINDSMRISGGKDA